MKTQSKNLDIKLSLIQIENIVQNTFIDISLMMSGHFNIEENSVSDFINSNLITYIKHVSNIHFKRYNSNREIPTLYIDICLSQIETIIHSSSYEIFNFITSEFNIPYSTAITFNNNIEKHIEQSAKKYYQTYLV